MKTAVVTGATSMLGIATIKRLIENNIRVIAISRANSRRLCALPESDLITFVGCELEELKSLDLPEVKADVFYHFGWGFTDKSTRNDPKLQEKNVKYTEDAIDLANKLRCTRFLGAGSQAEYGFKDCEITEDIECTPSIAYGEAKLKAYTQGRQKCEEYGMDYIWTRTFSVYGLHDGNSVIRYALNCFFNKEIAKFSAGTQIWNYLFWEDAGEYFYRLGFYKRTFFSDLLKSGSRIDCIVNIGNTQSKVLKEYFAEMRDFLGEGFKYELEDEKQENTLCGINPNVDRLISITDYSPEYSFSDGIKEIVKRGKDAF